MNRRGCFTDRGAIIYHMLETELRVRLMDWVGEGEFEWPSGYIP